MAILNVFEVTNSELSKALKESNEPAKKTSKKVNESVKKVESKYNKIAANKIKLESLQFVIEAEDNDEVINYTPEDDVVLVIDPDLDEAPADEEEAIEAAEELVGDLVCKCSICGANYVCDCNEFNENLDTEEAECPICGETGEQIVVGEITPTEEVATDDESEEDTDDVADDNAEDTTATDDADVDIDINIDDDDAAGEEDDDDFDYEESIQRAKRRTLMRREALKRAKMRKESAEVAKKPAVTRKPVTKRTAVESKPVANDTKSAIKLDEVTLNRMLTKMAKENYANVRFVKINNATMSKTGKLTLEGVVVTTKGSKRDTKFVCENFKQGAVVAATFTETGAFTESAGDNMKNNFTINFTNKNNTYTPVALRYSYDVKENKQAYRVYGKVMNESLNKKNTK